MIRVQTPPRADWQAAVEAKGLAFHTADDAPYWDESAYYLFEAAEVDRIEAATQQLDAMCLQAVEHVIRDGRLDEFDIPAAFHAFVAESWERDEHTIYGRFDLALDAAGTPRLLEYNADTPTALLEAAVIQWFWMQDLIDAPKAAGPGKTALPFDQFNSIHERLIEAWARVRRDRGRRVAFAVAGGSVEDEMTVAYLRDTAIQAGLTTIVLAVDEVGWNDALRAFTDLSERPIDLLFKLYPWEWMVRESFGRFLPRASTRWLEPPWKMVLSNKAILPVLWELFPGSPYLLPASFDPIGGDHVVKPFHSREGANVAIVRGGRVAAETGGDYGDGPVIYQQYCPLRAFDGRQAVIGSWIVNGHACGMGVREDDGPITRNTSRFVPHLFRHDHYAKPPTFDPKRTFARGERRPTPPRHDPLWDDQVDGI